ncbi:MAG: GGDEF domain-containing protein, partial [Pseudomonadota bacterium]
LGRVVEIGQICLENPSLELRFDQRFAGCDELVGEFMLRYPLDYEGRALGTLIVRRSKQFRSNEVRRIRFFVDSLRGPLSNAIKYLQVWQSAYHDALTGVRNRASLDLLLSGSDQRERPVTSMLVCDVDSFKSINDRYGHAVGDEVLCEFADLLAMNAGPGKTVYRYGGDEFVVIFFGSAADGGAQVAEQIRQAVMNHVMVSSDGHRIAITTTIGLAEVRDEETLDEAFLRADSALMQGKRASKNIVVSL